MIECCTVTIDPKLVFKWGVFVVCITSDYQLPPKKKNPIIILAPGSISLNIDIDSI